MKRQINGQGQISSVNPSKAEERKFSDMLGYMIDAMGSQFKNQTLKSLNQETIKKFEDSGFKDANFAKEFLLKSKSVQGKLLKRFSDDRIEAATKKILNKVSNRNRDALYKAVEESIGLSSKELTQTEGLTFQINALILETTQWAQKLRDETLSTFTANTLRNMALGNSLEDIMREFDGMKEERRNHAKFIARNQIANFNSITTKIRAQNLGIEEAIWITSRDEAVRPCHKKRDKKRFVLSEGLYHSCDKKTLLPGTDYQCRCTYELIIPGVNEDDSQ